MSSTDKNRDHSIGVIHPGQMGITLAAALVESGRTVCWAGDGRSNATSERAQSAQLTDLQTVQKLSHDCDYLFSVCPPDQALIVAQQVADAGFSGIYIDCNAVSPDTGRSAASVIEQCGARFVDGGIIGPPALRKGTTRLYLSGSLATQVAALFNDSKMDARVVGSDVGSASALKMAYAGWTKGSWALLMTQFALAQDQNVESALLEEWALSQPDLTEKLRSATAGTSPKAWRFVGEMNEIANSLEESGLPRQWFEGAADTYERLAGFKNRTDMTQSEVITALLADSSENEK